MDGSTNTAQNVNWWKGDLLKYGNETLELVGYGRGKDKGEPYILVIGVGHDEAPGLTLAQRNTVYYMGYIDDLGKPAMSGVDNTHGVGRLLRIFLQVLLGQPALHTRAALVGLDESDGAV